MCVRFLSRQQLATLELPWSIAGAATCFVLLFGYLIFQVLTANHDSKVKAQQDKAIKDGHLSASHIFHTIMNAHSEESEVKSRSLVSLAPDDFPSIFLFIICVRARQK